MQTPVIEGFRLSPQQERLWRIQRASGGKFYKVQCLATIEGYLDREAFTSALNNIIARHEVLRTGFNLIPEMSIPVQVISDISNATIEQYDLRGANEAEQKLQCERLYFDVINREFDYGRPPLLNVSLIALGDSRQVILISLASMNGDSDSLLCLLRELSVEYGSRISGAVERTDPIQYADVAEVFHALLNSEAAKAGVEYWRSKNLARMSDPMIGLESERGEMNNFSPAVIRQNIPYDLVHTLEVIARQYGTTLSVLLLTCWAAHMSRLSGRRDVLVGTLYDGRTIEGLDKAIGLFARYLPIEVRIDNSLPFADVLKRVDFVSRNVYRWQNYFDWKVVPNTATDDFNPDFHSICFDFHQRRALHSKDGTIFSIDRLFSCVDRFKIRLSCTQTEEGLLTEFYYDAGLFEEHDIRRLAAQYLALAESAGRGGDTNIAAFEILGQEERYLILNEFNHSNESYGTDRRIHQQIEAQAELKPDTTAVVYEDQHLSYSALNKNANQLANYLVRIGTAPESLIGVCLERGLEMAIGLLAIMKAGGAYVPLDPEYPKARLAFMSEDAKVDALLTRDRFIENFPVYDGQIISFDACVGAMADESAENPCRHVAPDNLVYVIYTSGSTGRPKGAMLTHEGIHNCISWMQDTYRLDSSDRFLFNTSLNFDPSVWEYFWPLWVGASVIMTRSGQGLDSGYLIDIISTQQVTSAYFVPSVLCVLLENIDVGHCSSLRQVICGGESLHCETIQSFFACLSADLHHSYGPTETSIAASEWTCVRDWDRTLAPIGKPLANVDVLALDSEYKLVPVRIPGELAIAGIGVGRGYLNRFDLTAERFLPDPFGLEAGARMYMSGDLGRFLPDGNIEFIGRVDQQVKIRGHRIELGEIESTMMQHCDVRHCAVRVLENESGDKYLVAYVAPAHTAALHIEKLREYMQQSLPEFMVPSAFVELSELPLMPNGKVDHKALPAPKQDRGQTGTAYAAPRTQVEEILVSLFKEVLKLDQVGIHDNFFEIGGHSLMATRMIWRVRETFRVEVPLRALFDDSTVAGLAREIERGQRVEAPRIVPADRSRQLPLSYAQQRLWFIDQLKPGNTAYNMPFVTRLRGELDISALRRAFSEIVRRHEVLRTSFPLEGGEPVQKIAPAEPAPVQIIELSRQAADYETEMLDGNPAQQFSDDGAPCLYDREVAVRELAEREARRGFDLSSGPLFRLTLICLAEQDHVLLVTLHHVVSDGWSVGILMQEFSTLYRAYCSGQSSPLPGLEVQYSDYAAWQRDWLQGEVLSNQLSYWKRQLANVSPLELPADYRRPATPSSRGATALLQLPAETTGRVKSLAFNEKSTSFIVLLAAFQLLLSRYANQDDVAVGVPIASRNQRETEGVIGFFVNMLVLRTLIGEHSSFRDLITQVRQTVIEAYAHQDLPFERLVQELAASARNAGRPPLFQVLFALQNTPRDHFELPGLTMETLSINTSTSKFDLSLYLGEGQDRFVGTIEYSTDLFAETTIERFASQYTWLVETLCSDPGVRLGDVLLLTPAELDQLLVDWNRTELEYPEENTGLLIAAQARAMPDTIAVTHDDEALTYFELDQRANQLAHYLRARGVEAETRVALCIERGIEMAVCLLGILKTGAAYVPLDPAYPRERLNYIQEDSGASALITQERLSGMLGLDARHQICLDVEWDSIAKESRFAPPAIVHGGNLAYIIYTSGSTGRPKGVCISHSALTNFLLSIRTILDLNERDVLVAVTTLCFDIAGLELYLPLIAGGRVSIASRDVASSGLTLASLLEQTEATVLQATPATWTMLLDAGWGGHEQLKILCGGEMLPDQLAERLVDCGRELWNLYGPTETTIWSMTDHVHSKVDVITIGRPIANTQIYVLDSQYRPVPVGVIGELYIGGEGLARGYFDQPGLSAQRFVPHPFSDHPGARLYLTGDMVRWMSDGRLQYIGRADNQVKIRGYRIETAEIETVLTRHHGVNTAVVVASGETPNDRQLVAYIVAQREEVGQAALFNEPFRHEGINQLIVELRQYAREWLPEYMVPGTFIAIDRLPLTLNGKLDRKALPLPSTKPVWSGNFESSRTPVEEIVAGIWSQVLQHDRVSINDNFFDLGGHSLLATQVISRVRETFRVEVPLQALFDDPTVGGLARQIEQGQGVDAPPIVRVDRTQKLPLSYAQQRLWFLDQLVPNNPLYNCPGAVRLEGRLNLAVLESVINEIVRRHEVLRTRIDLKEGEPVQVIEDWETQELKVEDLSRLDTEEREEAVRRIRRAEAGTGFDLTRVPLMRTKVLKLGEEEHVLLFTMHHIVSDAWSMGVLVREVRELYAALNKGKSSPLPDLKIQYADYACWQKQYLTGHALEKPLAYWKKQLGGNLPILNLPADRPYPPSPSYRGATKLFLLPAELAQSLRKLSRQEGATLFMTLLAAFKTLLYRYTAQEDIIVGTAIANRNRAEVEPLIGFFVNMLPIRTDVSGNPRFNELLRRVKEVALGAYAHQDIPFEKLVELIQPERASSQMPLFNIAFGVQNVPREGMRIEGVKILPMSSEQEWARLDLALWITEGIDEIRIGWAYSEDILEEETIIHMHYHFETLLFSIVDRPEARLTALETSPRTRARPSQAEQGNRGDSLIDGPIPVKRRGITLSTEPV